MLSFTSTNLASFYHRPPRVYSHSFGFSRRVGGRPGGRVTTADREEQAKTGPRQAPQATARIPHKQWKNRRGRHRAPSHREWRPAGRDVALRALTAGPPRPQRDLQPPGELREVLRSQTPLAQRPGVAAGAAAAAGVGAAPMPRPRCPHDPSGPLTCARRRRAPGTALTPPPGVETAADWLWLMPVTRIDM